MSSFHRFTSVATSSAISGCALPSFLRRLLAALPIPLSINHANVIGRFDSAARTCVEPHEVTYVRCCVVKAHFVLLHTCFNLRCPALEATLLANTVAPASSSQLRMVSRPPRSQTPSSSARVLPSTDRRNIKLTMDIAIELQSHISSRAGCPPVCAVRDSSQQRATDCWFRILIHHQCKQLCTWLDFFYLCNC